MRNLHVFLITNIFLALSFFIIFWRFGYSDHIDEIVLWSPDSKEYAAVAEWIAHGTFTEHTANRTLIYPSFYLLATTLFGFKGIWHLQFLLWLLSGNFTVYSVMRLTQKPLWCLFVGFLFAINVSLALLTAHALTEVLLTFVFSCFAVYLGTNNSREISAKGALGLVFFASILTLLKPICISILFIFILLAVYIIFKKGPKFSLVLIPLLILPTVGQMSLVKTLHGKFMLSQSGGFVIRAYLASQVYADVEKVGFKQARKDTESWEGLQLLSYLLRHSLTTTKYYLRNLNENLSSGSSFVNLLEGTTLLYQFSRWQNRFYYFLHIVTVLATVFLSIKQLNRIYHVPPAVVLMFIPIIVIIASSGTAFWAGDRLVLPVMPLWLVLYSWFWSRFHYTVQ